MLQVIRQAETKTEYAYRRLFQADYEAHGFLCDDNGDPIFKNARDKKLFYDCLENPNKYKDCGKVKRTYTHHSPALGRCECGRTVKLLRPWKNKYIACQCGRLYTEEGTEVPGERYAEY